MRPGAPGSRMTELGSRVGLGVNALIKTTLSVALVLGTGAALAGAAGPACTGTICWLDAAEGTDPEDRVLATWLSAWPQGALDRVLLDGDDIARLNQRNGTRPAAFQDVILGPGRSEARVTAELDERLLFMGGRLAERRYLEDVVGAFSVASRVVREAAPVDEIRALAGPADLRCVPMASGLYTEAMDRAFDRNQCSALHPSEVVRVSRRSADGRWWYVHAGHSVGWLAAPRWTPPLGEHEARAFRDLGRRLVAVDDWIPTHGGPALRMGTSLPLLGRTDGGWWHALAPAPEGLVDVFIAPGAAVSEGYPPLTRRAVLEVLHRRLGEAYGWGGYRRGRDCSRLLRDTLATFGVQLGRNSSVQARSGWDGVEVAGLSDADKRAVIRRAGERGIVFLYMPGHIMLYLGELDGTPYAISAISEYLVPGTEGGGHQVVRLDKVEVTTLELGRGTERTAFISRIARLAVFGR